MDKIPILPCCLREGENDFQNGSILSNMKAEMPPEILDALLHAAHADSELPRLDIGLVPQ